MSADEIKIEINIPIPSGRKHSELGNTIKKLKVGDSFLAPLNACHGTIAIQAKRAGIKYTTRSEQSKDPNLPNRIRVWRTE